MRPPPGPTHLKEHTVTEQPGQAPDDAAAGDPETDLSAGAPGPSGTGGKTNAGADPDAPVVKPS